MLYLGDMSDYITAAEAAERLDADRQQVYEWIWAGRLKAEWREDTRTWEVDAESVKTFRKRPRGRPRKNT